MADITMGRGLDVAHERAGAVEWVLAHREVVVLAAIMAVAAVLRFWELDAKALHHDESLHAQYTWYLAEGRKYIHDPLMHGPFKFHAGAGVFFLFGDTDFTSRMLPALFGTVLVGMPYLLRKQIGMKAVLIAALLLTISPTILYVSRFYRDDIYICVWVLAMVICVWRYLDEERNGWLYGLAALMALSFATMEITFIYMAILLLFLDLMLAVELGKRREDEAVSQATVIVRTLVLAPVAWVIAALWPLLARQPFGRERMPAVGDVLVLVGTLTLPQFAAGIQVLPFVGDDGYRAEAEESLKVATAGILLVASAYVGMLWRPKVWLIAASFFYVPYILLFTTFFTNQPAPWSDAFWRGQGGFFSGIWDSLDYWLDQHHEKRGDQPLYYYGLLTPLYEFLPLALALGSAAWLALRGDSLRRWLLFWLAGIFAGLSIAGEKMPWLEIHIALPLALAGAVGLAAAIDALELKERRWLTAIAAGALTAVAVLLLVEGGEALRLAGWVLGAGLIGWAAAMALQGPKAFGRAALAIAVAVLLTLTIRTSLTVSFVNDDTPVEMLVYVQSTPEIIELRDRIDSLAAESGLGRNLTIVVDGGSSGFAWPWAWYLRKYHDVQYIEGITPQYEPPPGAVLLIARSDSGNFDGIGYSAVPYKHRWWFCESYREPGGGCLTSGGLTAGEIVDKLTDVSVLERLGRFFLHRRPVGASTPSVDAVAFFPDSLSVFDRARPTPVAAEPIVLGDGRIVIGRPGVAPGELMQPADVFVDAVGGIWVADSLNNRVQKFDREGRYVASLGRDGTPPVALNEPWSLAVDSFGFVYVADTWSHRIVKFSPELKQVGAWGRPVDLTAQTTPGPLEMYGPRDIVVAGDGTLWVTDTGNKRLINFTTEGEAIGVYGREGSGAGEFKEPVGIVRDGAGRLYVADTWNGRVQRFEPGFISMTAIETGWTSQDVLAKPYIAVLSDGRLLATDPGKGVLLLFDAEGRALGSWRPEADSLPIGVAALADGGFLFSDARRGEVQVVPARLIGLLFK